MKRVGIPFGKPSRFPEQALRDLRAPTALMPRQSGTHAGRAQHVEHGHADLRLVIVGKGVVEDDGIAPGIARGRQVRQR